jgi:divalent metal cation (Fe/Co/Zn/Cd) transporter
VICDQDHNSDLGTGKKRAWVIGIMIGVTVVKFFLMILCRQYPDNEIVKAYGQDHFFDVITNSIGLGAALLGQAYVWWLDPFGAILVSVLLHFLEYFIYKTTIQQYRFY